MKRLLIVLALVGAAFTFTGTAGTAEAAVACHEMRMDPPINEAGIFCPPEPPAGVPATWKSYSLARGGPGYYVRLVSLPGAVTLLDVYYDHKAATPSAVAFYRCTVGLYGRDCRLTYWNGYLFPFGRP